MADGQDKNDPSNDIVDAEIVDDEIVSAVLAHDEAIELTQIETSNSPDTRANEEFEFVASVSHLSAKGGAVGGLLLAMLGLLGMTFSLYSVFNVLLAVIFSIWGLRSPLRKTAIAALLIALAGMVAYFVKLEM